MKKWLVIILLLLEIVLVAVSLKNLSEGNGFFFAETPAQEAVIDEA